VLHDSPRELKDTMVAAVQAMQQDLDKQLQQSIGAQARSTCCSGSPAYDKLR
jgi:hypothetical protein